jgi:MFS family permease
MLRHLLLTGARAALPLSLLAAPLLAQDAGGARDVRALSPARTAAQVGAGTLGTPIGFIAVGVLTDKIFESMGRDDDVTSRISLGAAYAGGALGAAAGPSLIGARGPGSGRFVAAVGGAAVGGLASWAIVRLVDRDGDEPPRGGRVGSTLAGIAVAMLPSVGATIGYNMSRRP